MKRRIVLQVVLATLVLAATVEGQGPRGGSLGEAVPATKASPSRSTAAQSGSSSKNLSAPVSQTQQQNINKLSTDLQTIKKGSQVTTAQKDALKNDLLAMAEGATKPDAAAVEKLATDLSATLADASLSSKEMLQLTTDLNAVMNSANISSADVQKAITDAQAILTASGVTQAEVELIVADLKAIAGQAQKKSTTLAAPAQRAAPPSRKH
jgi:hypothetical protein